MEKQQFKLHCALLEANGVKRADAPYQAWLEGPKKLQERLKGASLAHYEGAKEPSK